MPTIKDVAKLAGVSHGTVSNIINGYKTVNNEIVIRVEAAMKELGYQPDAKARSLRNNKSNLIGVVLPNITDDVYCQIYTGITEKLNGTECNVSLCLTNDCPDTEYYILNQLQQQRIDVLIIISCVINNTELFKGIISKGIKVIFLQRKPTELYNYTFIGFDLNKVFFNITNSYINNSIKEICLLTGNTDFSCEKDATEGFKRAFLKNNIELKKLSIQSAEITKESAFRESMWWLQSSTVPSIILTTCSEHAKGVLAAVELFQEDTLTKTTVVSLENESWVQNANFSTIKKIPLKFSLLGEKAGEKALLQVNKPVNKEADIFNISSDIINPTKFSFSKPRNKNLKNVIKLGLLEGAASYALRLMALRFTKQTGIEVEFEIFSYGEMQQYTIDTSLYKNFDIYQINIAWFDTLVEKNLFLPIAELLSNYVENFSTDILNRYGTYDKTLYAMPYMLDAQLLFYRKDLFEDIRNQRIYYQKYKADLQIPKNWVEYEQIAAFFSKSENIDSPIEYGTTMGGYSHYSLYGFMPYLWESDACLFDDDNNTIVKDNPDAISVLEQYAKAYSYADPGAINWDWAEQTTQFVQGNSAMMVLFQAHYMDYLSRKTIPIDGKIGVCSIPGNKSILGGWSLGIPTNCENSENASLFLQWLSSPENAIPYNILGGSIPTIATLESAELKKAYPWFNCAYKSLKNTKTILASNTSFSEVEFEMVFGKQINNFLLKKHSAQDVLNNLANILNI